MPSNTFSDPGLWRNKDFRLLLGGQLVSRLGDQLQNLAIPLVVLAITGSPTQAGLVLGLHTIAYLLVGLIAGALVDRWDRKATMIWCELGRAALTVSIPIAFFYNAVTAPQLYVVAILTGILTTLFQTANSSALPNIVPPGQLPAALGAMQASASGLGIVGASIAGAVYALGRAVPFGVNVLSFLVSAVTLRFIRSRFQTDRTAQAPRTVRITADIAEGLRWVMREPVIRFLTVVQAADNLRYGAGYLLIIVLAQRVGAAPFEIGVVFSGAAIAGLLGSVLSGRVASRFPLGRVAIVMLWVEAVAFPFYAVAPSWWWLAVVAFVESLVAPMYTVAMDTYRLAITPDRLRGRVNGAVGTLTTGAMSLGAIIGGVLLSSLGAPVLAVASGGWLLLLAIMTTANRTVRQAPVASRVLPADDSSATPATLATAAATPPSAQLARPSS